MSPTTTQPISAGPTVPYTIRMVNDTAVDADGNVNDKFSGTDWTTDAQHGPHGANLACTACHDFHGSSNAYLLKETIVSPDGSNTQTITGFTGLAADWQKLQAVCLTCHVGQSTTHHEGELCTTCHYHGSKRL